MRLCGWVGWVWVGGVCVWVGRCMQVGSEAVWVGGVGVGRWGLCVGG